MSLKVIGLKEELKKRGIPTAVKKDVLAERLREAIVANVPVSEAVGAVSQEAGMGGINATARCHLLTPNTNPIPEPVNVDASLRPPEERGAPVNPIYGYDERFVQTHFSGTTEKMAYMNGKPPRKRNTWKGYTPSRNKRSVPEPNIQVKGGGKL